MKKLQTIIIKKLHSGSKLLVCQWQWILKEKLLACFPLCQNCDAPLYEKQILLKYKIYNI